MPAATEIPDTKVCEDCDEELPVASFKKHRSSADGLQHRCIRCSLMRKLTSKKCAECGLSKRLDAYPENPLRSDGRGSWCTDCHDREARRTRLSLEARRVQRVYASRLDTAEHAYSA